MRYNLPFYSAEAENAAAEIYHTHPECRIAQQIAPDSRIGGTGDGRKECPFCFVLGQFRSNKFVDMPGTLVPAGSQVPAQAGFAASAHSGQSLA
ncbi:hypothetical protein [Hymenobacter convexus]|uniref:hypothetical protein n=1 Tax=Hymenobacter sp. CA1UV-4 TaxID=3063782 RepID=UPI002712D729|nr:hypothetical protein [Hymenobacter sp. CA1UV-4]MDO7850325.1 hypothetical protein [Hymenobacter sp. CA1UV-4]